MISLTKIVNGLFVYLCIAAGVYVHGQYRFDTWTTDDGLPQNGVRQITQTPDGYLWFTTFDGLVRFDGVQFTTFNKSNTNGIINNRFTGLFGDTDGTLYATTAEDGILTIYRNGSFFSFSSDQVPGNYINRVERGPSGEIRFLVEDEDRTSKSWYRLNDSKFEFIEKQSTAEAQIVFRGRDKSEWTITTTGVTKDGNQLNVPLELARTPQTTELFEDHEGSLWIGGGRIHRIQNGEVRTFGQSDGLPTDSAYHTFWQDIDGSLWSASGGIAMSSPGLIQIRNDKVIVWGRDHGLLSTSLHNVFTDREGTAWLATDRGLSRRRKQVIQGYSEADGIDHSEIYPIYRDRQDNIWIGSTKGLSVYRDGKFESLEFKPPSPTPPTAEIWKNGQTSVQSLWQHPDGKMWVGINGGIFIIDGGTARKIFHGSHVFAIKSDRHGNVWAATNKGLLQFDGDRLIAQYATKEGLPNEFMTVIFEDSKGVLWFGGYGGLSRFENGVFTNYTAREGLVGNYVRTIYEDADGVLWIGTYDEGMSRFKDGAFVNYKESDGLYSSGVFAIEEDEAGFFWISSNRGIYRVNRRDLNAFADGIISKINAVGYGKEDGMLSTECNGGRQPASLRTKDGKFWFPTQDGVAVIDPLAEQTNPLPPSVVIENVLTERQPVDFRGGAVINADQKDLEIQYTGISLIKSDQIKFKYKLENHDADWVDAGTRRTAYYSYLPPGEYVFRVKAANSDGVWNEQGSTVKINLKPYFYQTTTFFLLCSFAAAMLLLTVWKVSVHQLEANEKRLLRLVKERTAALADANENLQNLANSDGLTKIGNRRRFESFLSDEWHRAVRFKTEISLVLIDIDHFKRYNDTYGHQAGDECLRRVAEAFAGTIKRPTDLVARFGGEEFALILGGTDSAGAITIAEHAVQNVNELEIEHSQSLTSGYLTVSIGVATLFPKFDNAEADLIKAADEALYNAKASGRNRIFAYDHFAHATVNADVLSQDHFEMDQS